MKITDTLDQLLRLLVRPDEDGEVKEDVSAASKPRAETPAAKREPERPLPEWVRRAREHNLPAREAAAASPSVIDVTSAPEIEVSEPVSAAPVTSGEPASPVAAEPAEGRPVVVAAVEAPPVDVVPVVAAAADLTVDVPYRQPAVALPEPEQTAAEHRPAESALGEADPEPEVVSAAMAAAVETATPEPTAELAAHETDVAAFEQGVVGVAVSEPAPVEADAPAVDELEGVPAEPGTAVVLAAHDLARLETAARVAESLNLGFHLGSAVERIAAASVQGSEGVPALREAAWLIERYVEIIERRPIGADLHASTTRLARNGDTIAGLKALAEALDTDIEPERAEHAGEPAETEAVAAATSNGPEPEPDSWALTRIQHLSPEPPA